MAPLAGSFAPEEARHHRRVKRHCCRVIAHTRQRTCRRRVRRRLDQIHQARPRPQCRRIKSRPVRFRPCFAVGRDRCVNDPRVERTDLFIANIETSPRWYGHIGDKDIRLVDQPLERFAPLCRLDIERDTLLVPIVDDVAVGIFGFRRVAAARVNAPEGIRPQRRFDLDHVGAKVGQDYARRRSCNECRKFNYLDATENGFAHY